MSQIFLEIRNVMIKTFQRQSPSMTGWQSKAKNSLEIEHISMMNCPSGALSVFQELLQVYTLQPLGLP